MGNGLVEVFHLNTEETALLLGSAAILVKRCKKCKNIPDMSLGVN